MTPTSYEQNYLTTQENEILNSEGFDCDDANNDEKFFGELRRQYAMMVSR